MELKTIQVPIRILLDRDVYDRLKAQTPDHGMLSQLVRSLILKHLNNVEA